MTKQPIEEPKDVRVVRLDGSEVPVKIRYVGWHDERHCFEAIYPLGPTEPTPPEGLRIEAIRPPRTRICLRFTQWQEAL